MAVMAWIMWLSRPRATGAPMCLVAPGANWAAASPRAAGRCQRPQSRLSAPWMFLTGSRRGHANMPREVAASLAGGAGMARPPLQQLPLLGRRRRRACTPQGTAARRAGQRPRGWSQSRAHRIIGGGCRAPPPPRWAAWLSARRRRELPRARHRRPPSLFIAFRCPRRCFIATAAMRRRSILWFQLGAAPPSARRRRPAAIAGGLAAAHWLRCPPLRGGRTPRRRRRTWTAPPPATTL